MLEDSADVMHWRSGSPPRNKPKKAVSVRAMVVTRTRVVIHQIPVRSTLRGTGEEQWLVQTASKVFAEPPHNEQFAHTQETEDVAVFVEVKHVKRRISDPTRPGTKVS